MIDKCRSVLIGEIIKAGRDGRLVTENFLLDLGQEVLLNAEDSMPDSRQLLKAELPQLAEEAGISYIKGRNGLHFYATEFITDNYAAMKVKIDDSDFLSLVADQVRNESRIYPRATLVSQFRGSPFYMDEETLKAVLESIETEPEFKDIDKVYASNDDMYLYSLDFLKKGHAQYLAEWESVGCIE